MLDSKRYSLASLFNNDKIVLVKESSIYECLEAYEKLAKDWQKVSFIVDLKDNKLVKKIKVTFKTETTVIKYNYKLSKKLKKGVKL